MSRKPEIVLSDWAKRDLEEISDYIEARSGAERARSVLRKIASKVNLYTASPGAGRKHDELHSGMRSFVIFDYVVFYEALDDGIKIVTRFTRPGIDKF